MLGNVFGKKVFPLTWKMHTVLCAFYCKYLIWIGKCASCQMPKRIAAKGSPLSLSAVEGVQRDTEFSFAVCHLFNTTLAGFGFLSTRTGAHFYPTKLMAKSILPEISFCGRPWYEGIYVCYVHFCWARGRGRGAKLSNLPCAWSAPCVGRASSPPRQVDACPTRQWQCGCR